MSGALVALLLGGPAVVPPSGSPAGAVNPLDLWTILFLLGLAALVSEVRSRWRRRAPLRAPVHPDAPTAAPRAHRPVEPDARDLAPGRTIDLRLRRPRRDGEGLR